MIFVVCWSCGYCTSIKGRGVDSMNSARSIRDKHKHAGSEVEIIKKADLE